MHLEEFVQSRPGVEAFVEPKTAVTETTVVLVATTGEWTRRRVPSPGSRTSGPTPWASRPTTPPSSAIPSGCATGPHASPRRTRSGVRKLLESD